MNPIAASYSAANEGGVKEVEVCVTQIIMKVIY